MSAKKFTSDPTDCIDPVVGEAGAESLAAITPLTLFESTVGRYPTSVALALKRPQNGTMPSEWKTWTFRQYWNECVAFAKSLLFLGIVQPRDVVNIIGFNSVSYIPSYYCSINCNRNAHCIVFEAGVANFVPGLDDGGWHPRGHVHDQLS